MKFNVNAKQLKFAVLAAGVLGMLLRIALYETGIDGRGLLEQNHWAGIALWVLTGITAAALLLFGFGIKGPAAYADAYPVSFSAAVGCFAAAAGFALTSIREFAEFSSRLNLIIWVLGLFATLAIGYVGFCRLTQKKPYFLAHALMCVYFSLRMVSQYRQLSFDPHLLDYCFHLTAYVALMLSTYQQAAFDAAMGNHRALWLSGLAAVYLCCVALKNNPDIPLLVGCAIWVFTNLTSLTLRQRRQRPVMEPLSDEPPEA